MNIPKGIKFHCRHCGNNIYVTNAAIGLGRIDLPDGGWTYAQHLNVHTVDAIPPQTLDRTNGEYVFDNCVHCGANDFGM